MGRKLVWPNLYGSEAVQHMLKNGLKTQKMDFSLIMLDSLTAIKVEPDQCPWHQSTLLIQGPSHKNFTIEETRRDEYSFYFKSIATYALKKVEVIIYS